MRLAAILGVMAMGLPGVASAEVISGKEARKLLFNAKGTSVEVVEESGLDELSLRVVTALVDQKEFKTKVIYYGALAFSPAFIARAQAGGGDAVDSGLANYVDGYHSIAAAERAALAGCRGARRGDEPPCVIAVRVLPKRYKPRALSLSTRATAAFKAYRKGKGDKAMAISPSGLAYAIAKGEDAAGEALAACNIAAVKDGLADCILIVKD